MPFRYRNLGCLSRSRRIALNAFQAFPEKLSLPGDLLVLAGYQFPALGKGDPGRVVRYPLCPETGRGAGDVRRQQRFPAPAPPHFRLFFPRCLISHNSILRDNIRDRRYSVSNDETYLTIRQVAELLQLRQETVRRNITKGNIEAFQLGGPKSPWRIPPDALEKLEKSRRED